MRLARAVPAATRAWANDEAPRLIAAAAGTAAARAALAENLCALANHLPQDGVPLSVLADQTVHNTHGLDPGTTLGRLGARRAAAVVGLSQPASTADVREAWEAVGVWADRISSQITGWNLPLFRGHPAAAVRHHPCSATSAKRLQPLQFLTYINPLGPFAMYAAFPRSDYYGPSAPPCGRQPTTSFPPAPAR